MKRKEDYPKIILWTAILILGIFAYIEYFQIYMQTLFSQPNYWQSKRFVLLVIISAVYLGLFSFSFISIIKRKNNSFDFKTKIPDWLIVSFVYVFFIITPFILIWVRPLWERLIPGLWIKLFLTVLFFLAGAWILGSMNVLGKKHNNLNIILSIGVIGYISYFIFTIVYYRIPFGDDVLGQFFNAASFYFDGAANHRLGEQIFTLPLILKNLYLAYFTWGARLVGYVLIPLLGIFGIRFTALFTTVCFVGILLLTVKNIYFDDNPLSHPVSILFCFLTVFYFDKGIGMLMMFTMASIYAFSVFLLLLFFTVLRTLIVKNGQPNKTSYLLVNLLGLIAGFTHEVYSLIFLFISFAAITILVTEKTRRKQFYFYLVGLTLGVLIMYTAPGNFFRLAQSHDANRMVTPLLARISNSFINFEVFPKNNSQLFYKFFACLYLVYILQCLNRIRTNKNITLDDIFFWSSIGMVIFWGIFPFAPPYARFGFLVLISIACLSALSKVDLLTKLCLGKWKQYLSVLLLIIILSNLYVTDAHWMGVFQNHSIKWQETVQEAKISHKEFVYVQKFPSEAANRFTQSKIMNNEKSYKTDYFLRYFGILIIPR